MIHCSVFLWSGSFCVQVDAGITGHVWDYGFKRTFVTCAFFIASQTETKLIQHED